MIPTRRPAITMAGLLAGLVEGGARLEPAPGVRVAAGCTCWVLSSIATLDLPEPVFGRARDAFPDQLRTLDALHLASLLFLREQGVRVRPATYDKRMRASATALGVELYDLGAT